MKGKQFSLAMMLALFLLTVASAPWSGQQSGNSYDAWLDYNDDGLIDINELHQIGQAYGSSGEPTRNVTVSSHATSFIRFGGASNISIPALSDWLSEMITVDGYAKFTILIKASAGGSNVYADLYAYDDDGHEWVMERPQLTNVNCVKTYDVGSQGIRIRIYNFYPYMVTADVAVYLMA